MTSAGNWWVDASTGSFGITSGRFSVDVNVTPNGNNGAALGTSGYRWNDIWATNSNIQSSDRSIKKDIQYGLSEYDALFDALRPVSYKFVDGTSGRTHMGIIAQDLEESLNDLGISTQDCAAFVKAESDNPDMPGYDYAVRYGEFIPLLIYQVQKIKEALKDKGVIS